MRPPSHRLAPFILILVTLAALPTHAADATLDEGNALLAEGEYRKAWARFQEVASTQGASAAALLGMARAALPLGEYAVAADLSAQVAAATQSVRDRVDALTLMGRAHMEATFFSPEHVAAEKEAGLGYLDRAVEHLSAAVAASPALASEATYWLSLAHLEQGENDQAAEAAATYLVQRPEGLFAAAARSIQTAASGETLDPNRDPAAEITPPSAKRKLRPEYSGKAREQGVCGMVITQGVLDKEGRYNDVVLLKGIEPALDEKLLKQLSRSRYEPAQADGQPTAIHHRVFLPISGRGNDPARQIIPVE